MTRWLARTPWPWVLVGLAIQAIPFAIYSRRSPGEDLTGLYLATPEFYEGTILREVYPREAFGFATHPYDPFYFLALANDPTLDYHVAHADESGWVFYRGRRILWPWVGWAPGLGRPALIPSALILAQFLLLGLGLWAFARVLIAHGRHPAWCLLHASALGTTICVIRPLADLFVTNLVVLGAWARLGGRDIPSALLFTLAGLGKETSLLIPAAVSADRLARGRWRRGLVYAIVPAVAFAWWASLSARLPAVAMASHSVGPPFVGFLQKLSRPLPANRVVEVLAAAMSLVGLAAVFLAPRRDWHVWRMSLVLPCLLMVLSTHYIWVEHWSYARVHAVIPALLLWCYAIRGRRLDLAGPILSASAGCLVWLAHLGYHQPITRFLGSLLG